MGVSSFLKGFFYDGPKEAVRGVLDLTSLEGPIKGLHREMTDPGITSRMLQNPEGREQILRESFWMVPGMKPLQSMGSAVLHPVHTWNGIKSHYQQAWRTEEGKGKITFEAATLFLSFTKLGKLAFLRRADINEVNVSSKNYLFSQHGWKRMAQRGINIKQVENVLLQGESFPYFHDGIWKMGYYDPHSKIFVGVVENRISTLMKSKPQYIKHLKEMKP